MPHYPSFDEFAALARTHSVVPVYRRLVGDTLTPVSAFCKIQEGDWAFLFESVVGGERLGRYSFLGAGPFLTFQAYGKRVITQSRAGRSETEHPDPLRHVAGVVKQHPDERELPDVFVGIHHHIVLFRRDHNTRRPLPQASTEG